jgi:DNA-binding NarL/FixJ family response regulator
MLKFLIADDHEIVRRGLKQILLEEFTFSTVEEAGDTQTLVSKALEGDWSIVISDLAMPGGGGLEALRKIKEKLPQLPVLILSIYPADQYAVRVIKAGAAGYVNKDTAPDELVKAVQHILTGKKYISQDVAEQLSTSLNLPSDILLHHLLSDREIEVFKMLAEGKSITDIASVLNVSATTVSTYRSRILTKMNLKTNAQMTQYALEHKLI